MDFLIADTFTDSLTRLTAEEHKSVKTSAFDVKLNPAHPGLSIHTLDTGCDKNFWSIRVGSDIRLIVHIPQCDGTVCWSFDTNYNEESFFVRHAYFLGASDPYKSLKTTLKAEINAEAWESLHSDTSRPFDKRKSGRIAVKVINHLGDEVMKVFRVD